MRRHPITKGFVGDVKATLEGLLPKLNERSDRSFRSEYLKRYAKFSVRTGVCAIFTDRLTLLVFVLIMFFSARTSSKRHGERSGWPRQPPSSMRTWMLSMPP
jgi:hypothetical protein